MRFRLTPAPAEMVERKGEGFFEPAHAAPYTGTSNRWALLYRVRDDYLSVFRAEDYSNQPSNMRLLGRQLVVVNSPEDVKYVFATRHDNFERKSPQMRRALEFLLGDGLFISDGETWRTRRPLVADIVHKHRVPQFGRHMETVAGDMARRWSEVPAGTVLNALVEMAALTAEIISRAVFGKNLGRDSAMEVIEGFTSYQRLVDNINLGYLLLRMDEGLPVFRGPRLRHSVARVHKVIDHVIAAHLEGRGEDNSMVDLLLRRQRKNPELKLDREALRNEAATIFMAGHETTAATLTWTWYLLSNAPWAEDAVHREIERVCGARAPTVEDVPRLDYCRCVIEETLRLYPPVPMLARQAKQADRIGAIDVQPAALVVISPWILHRNFDLWERPHQFVPERFLGEQRPQPYSYIPFSAGPRICAGLNFGLTESILCLAILAQRFKVRVPQATRVQPQSRLTLRPRGGLPILVQPR